MVQPNNPLPGMDFVRRRVESKRLGRALGHLGNGDSAFDDVIFVKFE